MLYYDVLYLKGGDMFKVGDKVVYPSHGVGVVEDIQHREIQFTLYGPYSPEMIARKLFLLLLISILFTQ